MRITLLALSFILMTGCANLQNLLQGAVKHPTVNYKSVALGDVNADHIEIKPTLSIFNPNGFSVPVDSLDYELSINDKNMVSGKTDKVGTLPAKQSKDLTLGLVLSQQTLKAFQDLLFKEDKITYKIKGFAKVMGLKVPYNHSDTIVKPKISFADVKVGNASFSKLGMNLLINIENPNSFSIPLDSLNYQISSKAKSLLAGNLKGQTIKPGKNQISLPLNINPRDFFSNLFALLQSPKMPVDLKLNSPMFNYSGKQNIDLSRFF